MEKYLRRLLTITIIFYSAIFISNPAWAVKSSKQGPKNDYNITINYELGMHCTGFDFSYCCILPPYNSIQSQVVKTAKNQYDFPVLLGADPKDPTVLLDGKKRMKLEYGHVDNSFSEGTKLAYWNVPYDVNGDGKYGENENVGNAYFTHLYVYKGLEGANPKKTSKDSEKKRIGIEIPIPKDMGPAGAVVPSPLKGGHLHYTGEKGTIVYTKSPVLDNVPIVLTNPGIWDALGLPLTPFYDNMMKKSPLEIVESDIRPYQEAWVALVDAKSGKPVIDSHSRKPVKFIGTNPIDVPNCANCHSNENANGKKYSLYKQEKAFWKGLGATEYMANLKATSISILQIHDNKHGTQFVANYDPSSRSTNNRLGSDPVLCQQCHADNVIGVLQSKGIVEALSGANVEGDTPLPALSEALHRVHQTLRPLPDSEGRTATCAGCHPAHRQDGSMDGYPITPDGKNFYADADNRDTKGGCFAGRDVHSNPNKDKDGVGTPEHLNAIGKWMQSNVSNIGNGKEGKGLWCTNCHSQLSRELYQRDNIKQAFKQKGKTLRNKSLKNIAKAIGVDQKTLEERYLDPKVQLTKEGADDPKKSGILLTWAKDRLVADIGVIAMNKGGPLINKDEDGDINVTLLSADPSVKLSSLTLPKGATGAAAVSYDAASHGRDYWLSPGVPHCADCHAPPFVEGQGGVAFPINQPGKYSQMRYSKGHAGLACQACHESIHGLYPVTPTVDTTTYQQATQYNPDGSHGPLLCASCHQTNEGGVPLYAEALTWKGKKIGKNLDAAISWIHSNAPDLGGKIPH
ncbi:MAG: hypothetical protein V3V31_01810 [Methylococcales bacterium]